ncbi:CCL14 protein, partial [Bombycilla garrulus]|nr:CCL14 protein [Bombycilla garrulus]
AAPYAPFECCFSYITRPIRLDNLLGFYKTTKECFLPATVFETKRGSKVCANPEEKWVKRAIKELLKKKLLNA